MRKSACAWLIIATAMAALVFEVAWVFGLIVPSPWTRGGPKQAIDFVIVISAPVLSITAMMLMIRVRRLGGVQRRGVMALWISTWIIWCACTVITLFLWLFAVELVGGLSVSLIERHPYWCSVVTVVVLALFWLWRKCRK